MESPPTAPTGLLAKSGFQSQVLLANHGLSGSPMPHPVAAPGCGAILVALGCLPVNKLLPFRPEPPKPGQGLFYHSGKRVDGSAVPGDPGQSDRIRWTQTERNVKGRETQSRQGSELAALVVCGAFVCL